MKDLLSRERHCSKIHTLLMKKSAEEWKKNNEKVREVWCLPDDCHIYKRCDFIFLWWRIKHEMFDLSIVQERPKKSWYKRLVVAGPWIELSKTTKINIAKNFRKTVLMTEAYSELCQTSKMEFFAKIVDGWKPSKVLSSD